MFEEDVFKRVIDNLNQHNIPYMLTGGLATTIWGRVRSTLDIDIVLDVKKKDAGRLLETFQKDFYIDAEAVEAAFDKNISFNAIDIKTNTAIDCYLSGDSQYEKLRFQRKIIKNIVDIKVNVISPEDLILIKLLWRKTSSSERQLDDVRSIFRISGEKLDMKYLNQWAKKLGVSKILNKLL